MIITNVMCEILFYTDSMGITVKSIQGPLVAFLLFSNPQLIDEVTCL